MASVSVVLRKKKNSEGKYPISIRVTKDRKSSFISIGQYISEDQWDVKNKVVKKSHPNSARLNNIIQKRLYEANDKYLELESQDKAVTAKIIQKQVKKKDIGTTFSQLADTFLFHKEKAGKYGTYLADKSRINHFKDFLPNGDIAFPEITEVLLKKYITYLKVKLKNGERSIVNNLIIIRTLFNLAIRDGIVDKKYYPFGKGKVEVKIPQSIKIGLTIKEVKDMEELDLKIGSP